ncbi:hypothetical protein FZC33_28915 [Labrys sp. KNU-23]|uniref:hypothetical protein n=1 Tax=Labrys sp. KNU-23 TaxID=2789216 RepID=UPI0011EDDC6C|nr:hypothetical protein [Labrys sp. KNU-23]QEN90082.1 hypothetical protein FZC33_28915 [Labrys sp. KNU-23]
MNEPPKASDLSDDQLRQIYNDTKRSSDMKGRYRHILNYRNDLNRAAKFTANGAAQVHTKAVAPFKYNGCEQLYKLVERLANQKLGEAASSLMEKKPALQEYEDIYLRNSGDVYHMNREQKDGIKEFWKRQDDFKQAEERNVNDFLDPENRVRLKACRTIAARKKELIQIYNNPQPEYYSDPSGSGYTAELRSADQVKFDALGEYKRLLNTESKVNDQTKVTWAEKTWEAHGDKIQVVGGGIVVVAGLLAPEVSIPVAAVVGGSTAVLAGAAGDYQSAALNVASAIPLERFGALLGRAAGFGSKEAAASMLAAKSSDELAAMKGQLIKEGASADEVDRLIAAKKKAEADEKTFKDALGEDDHTGVPGEKKPANPKAETCPC